MIYIYFFKLRLTHWPRKMEDYQACFDLPRVTIDPDSIKLLAIELLTIVTEQQGSKRYRQVRLT